MALLQVIRDRDMRDLPWSKGARAVQDRIAFVKHHEANPENWPDIDDASLLETLEEWLLPYLAGKNRVADLADLKLEEILQAGLEWEQQQKLDQFAPSHMKVPTGSRIRLDYSNPDIPVLAVRLQELFGQQDIEAVAGGTVPVTLHLLSPAGRPAQITKDLAGFWQNSYADVKKDLKGRYPKHYWPDDPLQAEPTARAKPRK